MLSTKIAATDKGTIGNKAKRRFKALVSMVTAVAFLSNTLMYDSALASQVSARYTQDHSGTGAKNGYDELGADNFSIPDFLGEIKSRHDSAGSGTLVVHIQDAHCNYDCQKTISGIISYIHETYGINTVNLEGGDGRYDLSVFTAIQDAPVREKVADYFVSEGILSGAEYFSAVFPGKAELWGIEDPGLYAANREVYRGSLKNIAAVNSALSVIHTQLNALKDSTYSDDLKDLDKKYGEYKSGEMDLKDYLSFLFLRGDERGVDRGAYPNISSLYETAEQEKNIDFRDANSQRHLLIDRMGRNLPPKMVEELGIKTLEFRSGEISQTGFYEFLSKMSLRAGISLSEFPELEKYIKYVSLYDSIDKSAVISEMSSLEEDLCRRLSSGEKDRELWQISRNLTFLENMFATRLTREEYSRYKSGPENFSAERITAFIEKENPAGKLEIRLASAAAEIDRQKDEISGFYEYSFKRDDVFLEKMKFSSRGEGGKRRYAMLVTGGFHSENLGEIFREKGFSYVAVMPKFRNCEGYESPYYRLLGGEESPVIAAIKQNASASASALALYGFFCATSGEVNGDADVNAVKTWVKLVTAVFSQDLSDGPVDVDGAYRVREASSDESDDAAGIVLNVDGRKVIVTYLSSAQESAADGRFSRRNFLKMLGIGAATAIIPVRSEAEEEPSREEKESQISEYLTSGSLDAIKISDQYLYKVKEFISDRVFSDIPTIYSESQLPPWFLFRHYCALEFGETGTSAPGKSGLHVSKANAHGPIQMWTDQAVQLNKNLTTWRTSKRSKDSPRDREKLKALEDSFAKFGFNIDKGIEVARIKKDAKYSVAMAVANLKLIFMDWERFFEKSADPVERNVMERQKRFYTLSLVALHNSSPITVKLAIQNGGEAWVEKLRDETIGLMWRFCVFLKAVNTDPDVAALFAEIDPQINIPEDAFLPGEESPVPLMATRELEPVNFDVIMSRVDEAAYEKEKQPSKIVNELTMKSFGISDLVIYALAGAGAAVISRRMLFSLKNTTPGAGERTMQDKSIDMVARVFSEYGKEISYEEAKFVWLAMKEDLRIGGMDDSPLAVQRGLIRLISEMSPDGFLDAFREEYGTSESPAERLFNRLRNIFSPGREGSDSDDVNIAAGGSIKVTHTDVNKFVGDNLPRGLWGESFEERAENLDNLVEEGTAKVRVTDDGTEVVLIPIKGLFRACGQFGHIGLGRAYGKPVAWIDADYMDNDTVIGHELYEIDRWEQHRKTLGYDPDMMRGWIRANFEKARKLAAKWHNENKYSVEDLLLENKTGVQVERLNSILERMKGFYSGEKFKEYIRSLAVKYAENGLELVNIDGLEGELLSRIEEIISGVDLKVLSESRSPIGIRGSTIEVLLAYAEYMSDEELAIVLGHEVGHELADIFLPELSPDAKFLRQAAALPTDLAIIGEDGEFLSIIHQVYRHGGKKRESAENEIQQRELFSDEIGIFLAGAILPAELRIRAGEIAGDVLNKTSEFIDNNLKDDSGSGFLSVRTHPSIEARAANLGVRLGIEAAATLTGVDPLKEASGIDKGENISGQYPLRDILSIFEEMYGTDFDPQETDRDVNLAAGPGKRTPLLRKKPLLGVILDHVTTLGHKPGDEIIVGFSSDGTPIKGIFRSMDEYGEEITFSSTGFNFGAIIGKNKVLSSERYLLFNRYAEDGAVTIGGEKYSLSGMDFRSERFPEIDGMSLREVLRYMAIKEEGGWCAWDYPLVSGYDLATKNETEEDKRSLAGRPRGGMAFYSLKEGRLVTYMYTSVEAPNGKGVEWRIARIESGKPLPQNETAAPSYLVNGIRDVEDMGQENFENFFDMYCSTDSWDRSLIRAMAAVLRGEKDAEKLKNLLRPFDKYGDEVRVSPEEVRVYMEARAGYTALKGDDDKRRTDFYNARSFLMGLYGEKEKSGNYLRYFGKREDSAMNKLASLDDVLRRYSSVRFPSEKEVSPEVQEIEGEVKPGDSISFGSETFVLEFTGGKYFIAGKVLEDGGTYTVGRSSGSYIRVLNGSVSREHAVIKVVDGKVFVEDNSSMNGTRVNGKKIASAAAPQAGQRREAAPSSRVYAVFNNWQNGLVNIAGSMDEVKAHNYDDSSRFHIIPVDVPQDVYVGAHQSSIISARAAADIDNVKPGSRVLVIGTGMGLEAYIAMGRGAHVDAVDINPSALKSTENLCDKLPPEGKGSLRTFLYDVMPGGIRENELADEYDLIIFNMPHYAAPRDGDDKEITATRDPGGQLLAPTSEIVKTHLASGGRAVLVNSEGENVRRTLEGQIGLTVFSDPIYGMDPSMAYVVENGNNAILNDLINLLGIDVSRNFGVRKQLVALAELIRRKQLAAGGVSVIEVTEKDLSRINIPDIIGKVRRLDGKTLGMLGMGGTSPAQDMDEEMSEKADAEKITRRGFLGKIVVAAAVLNAAASGKAAAEEMLQKILSGTIYLSEDDIYKEVESITKTSFTQKTMELRGDAEKGFNYDNMVRFLKAVDLMFKKAGGVSGAMIADKENGQDMIAALAMFTANRTAEEMYGLFQEYAAFFKDNRHLIELTREERNKIGAILIYLDGSGETLEFTDPFGNKESIYELADTNFIAAMFIKFVINSPVLSPGEKIEKLKNVPRYYSELVTKMGNMDPSYSLLNAAGKCPLVKSGAPPLFICREAASFIQEILDGGGRGRQLGLLLDCGEFQHIVYLISKKADDGRVLWGYIGFNPKLHYSTPIYESLGKMIVEEFSDIGCAVVDLDKASSDRELYRDVEFVRTEEIDEAFRVMEKNNDFSTGSHSIFSKGLIIAALTAIVGGTWAYIRLRGAGFKKINTDEEMAVSVEPEFATPPSELMEKDGSIDGAPEVKAQSLMVNLLSGRAPVTNMFLRAWGVVSTPFHEFAHYLAALMFGANPKLSVSGLFTGEITIDRAPPSKAKTYFIYSAGLLANLALAGASAYYLLNYGQTVSVFAWVILSWVATANAASALTEIIGALFGKGDLAEARRASEARKADEVEKSGSLLTPGEELGRSLQETAMAVESSVSPEEMTELIRRDLGEGMVKLYQNEPYDWRSNLENLTELNQLSPEIAEIIIGGQEVYGYQIDSILFLLKSGDDPGSIKDIIEIFGDVFPGSYFSLMKEKNVRADAFLSFIREAISKGYDADSVGRKYFEEDRNIVLFFVENGIPLDKLPGYKDLVSLLGESSARRVIANMEKEARNNGWPRMLGDVLVHRTDYLPEGGVIKTLANAIGWGGRETVHFTPNRVVEDHAWGSWEDKPYTVVIPQAFIPKSQIKSVYFIDTFLAGNVELPEGAVVFGIEDKPLGVDIGKATYIKIEPGRESLDKAVADVLEVYRGLQTIGGSITYGEGVYNTLHDETIWKRYEEAVMHDADNIVSDVIVQMIIPNGLLDSQESRRYEADASVSLSDISGRMIVSEIIFRVIRTLRMIDSFDSVNVRRTLGDDAERMSDRLKREVSEYLSYAGISDLGVDDLMKIYAGGNLIGNEDIFRIADGMFDRWLRIHMGEGQTLQEAMVPYVDRFKIYNSSFELESDEESVKQVEEGLRRFMAEGTYLTDTGFSYASPAALRDKEAQPGQGIGGRVFGDAASIATKEISARPLTKEYAEKHAEELLLLHHLIHGQAWTKEQLLADVWEKGKFGMAEDRPFKGKWKHSRVAIDSSGKPVGLLIAYERPAGEMGGVEGEPVYVHAIAVDPGYQRRNIGRDLMLDLVKNIVPGNAPIALQTGMDNVPAQNFYRNLGFKEVGRKEYPATTQDAAHTDLVLAASVKDVMYAADPDGAVIQSIPETAEPVVAEESPEELEAREFIEADPDFVAAIAPYQYLTDLYGYRPFLDLFEAAGELPKVFFKYSMSNLEEAFLGKGLKLEDFWPDIIDLVRHVSSTGDEKDVQYMISRGIPDLVSVFTAEEFKKFWPGLVELGKALPGPNAGFLFHDYIPMMVKPFSSKELEEYWPDLVRLGKEAEPNAGYLLGYAIPALSNIITTREELNSIGNDLIRLDKAAGNRAEYLFRTGIPELRETFKDKLKEYWPGLVRMGVAAGPAAKSLYYDGISKIESGERAIWRFFPSKKFDEYWPGLVETAVEAGPGAAYLFMVVLPALARDEYLETNWESLAGEAGKRPVAEAAAVLFAEDYKDGIDWVDRLTEFQDDVRTMYLVLKLLDDKTELHLRHLLFTRRYAEIRKMIESGEVTPVEVAGLSLEARMADIAAYSTERMLSGAHEGKVDMFGNFILLPGLTPLDEKINVKAVTKEELLKELSDCGIEGAEAALREAIAKEGMTLEKTAAGEAIVPIVLDTALSAYRGSRETDGIYANYLTHAITTAIFKYAKIGGENANYIGEDAAQAASGDKAAHEFDINMMNLSGISGREVDTAVSLAFSYGRKTRLPEYARKRTVNIYAYTFSGHIRELMRYQMTERRAKQNIRQIFEWLSSGVLDETQLVNAIEALKTELAVLDPWSGTCGLNDDYFDAVYGYLDGKFFEDLTTQYKPGSDNKEIIRGLLFKAMSQKKVLTTREVGDTPEEYAPHPWIARGITLIDYLDNEEYILKGTSGYADLSTLHTPSDLMVETVVPDVYSYFANDPLGKNIPREVIEAGIVPTGMGGLTFGFTSPEGETQLKAITADIEKLVDEKINSKQRTFVIRDIGPGDGSELVSILGQLNAVIGKNDPGEKWEVVIDVADNNESILAEAEETIRAEMAGFENITCNVRYSKVDVFDAAGLNALRTTGAAGNTDYIIFRNVLNIKQHIDRGDFELKDMAASFIALRNLIENFAGEDTKLVIEPYPIQPQNGLLANGILDAGVIKSFQEDNGFSNFLNLFGASDMMPVGISAPSPVEELPEARTDGKGMSRRRFLEGVGAIALTAAMDTAALDVESFLAEATPEELAEKLLTRDRINEESFEKMTNEYEYLTQAFSKINFSEFSRHKPSEKEIKFLAGLIKHCQEVDPEKLNKLLGAVENVIIIENGPHEGGAGFGVFSNNSVVLEFDSDLPTLSEVSTPIYAGLLIHEAAHVEGARKEVPITGILSEIYARLEVLDWKGVGANPQSWIDEEQYMVDMITLGIEEVKAEKSIAGKNVTRHDMEDSEAGKVWDYYWANGVTRMEAVRFMGAARGLLMMEGYADSEVKYISGTGKLRPDTKEREKGQPVKGYWIAFDLGGGKTAEIFSGVDEKDGLCVFYDGEWTKLSFKLEEAKAKMGRGFDGIGELTVAASAKWHKGMKDEAEKREALSPSLDLEELTAALDTNPAMDVREFHKATDSFISTRSNGLYDLFNNSDQDIRRAELERIVRRKYAGKYMGEIPAHILKDKNGKDVVSREGDKILVVARGMLKPFSLFARVENEKPLPGLSVIWVDNAFYGKEELENLILSGNPAERSEDVLGGLYRTLPDSLKNEIGQARINRIFDRIHTAAQTHLNEYYSMRAHPDVAAPKKEKERELPILTVKVNSDGKLAFAQGWMNTIQFRIDMHEWSSEDELAFVVAHECDHIWRDKDFDHDNFGLMVAAQIMADEGGVHLMKWAGYDPDGAIEAFDKWVDTEANRTGAPEKSLGEISARKAALRSAVETFKAISSDSEMKDSSGDGVEILSRSGSLIGKVEVEVEGKLKVLTDGFAAREVTRDGKKMLSVSHAELAEDIPVSLGGEVEDAGAVKNAVSSLLSGAKFLNDGYDAELKQLMEAKLSNITRIVALNPNENVMGFFSDNTLYVNESLLADNMALIHELGESLAEGFMASLAAEYPGINMHTYMRGAGKDVHRAYSALKDSASILKESGARGLIDAINVKMKELTGRPEMSPAEEALILLNASQRGTAVSPDKDPTRGLLFGFQDRLDPSGNVRLSKHIGQVLNDMNRGALNIMVLPAGDIMSEAAKKSAGRQASRTLERKFGTNTRVYSFTSDIVSSIKTAMAEAEKAMENTQEKVYPKIFVNCVSLEQKNNEVMPYLETLSPDARNMIVVNYENIPDAERSTIDEVAMIMVGSAILNDHRLSVDFKLPKEALSEGRKNMITAFSEAGIIKIEENDDLATAEGLDSIMQKFYTGQRPLTINKINWQELRDYQDSMDLILKSV